MTTSKFLDLPAELRNWIYELALVKRDGPIDIPPRRNEPALLMVNRQIRKETRAIFWSGNIFQCRDIFDALEFLHQSDNEKTSLLRAVRGERIYDPERYSTASWLHQAKALLDLARQEKQRLRKDVLKFPLEVYREEEIVWVDLNSIREFEADRLGGIVRKKQTL